MKEPVYWTGDIGTADDFGERYTNGIMYDARLNFSTQWANLSEVSFARYGVGLGTGKGQKYKQQPDGKWLKIDG